MPVPSREPFSIGRGLRFQILDRALASTTVAEEPYSVISITGSGQVFTPLAESPLRRGVLRIRCDDIPYKIEGMVLFDGTHARQIIDFFTDMRSSGVRLFKINCEQGRCRSAGVGAALAEIAGGRTSWFDRRFEPNAHVRRVLIETSKADNEVSQRWDAASAPP